MITVARDKIENVSGLIYNIVIGMTFLSFLSGNGSGYQFKQRFMI